MIFSTLFELFGTGSIIVLLVILAQLSQRLGAVTRRPPVFRWLYIASILVALSIILHVIIILHDDDSLSLLSDVPMVIGLLIGIVIVWRYWSWLLGEKGK